MSNGNDSNGNDDPSSIGAGIPAMKRLNLHITPDLHRRIKLHATAQDRSMTEMVVAIVRENLDKR